MVEEAGAPASEASVTEAEAVNALNIQPSNEATIESTAQGGMESTCNNGSAVAAEASGPNPGEGSETSLELADEFMEKGSRALKYSDHSEAAECFSRALEIRVARFGELSPECITAYYKYGCALLYKAQEEADPLGAVPKKEGESQQESAKDGSVKNVTNGESSGASASCKGGDDVSVNNPEGVANDVSNGNDQEEGDKDSDAEDLAEADEDESDLDLAWKMLDVARAIAEKQSGDAMEKVDILSALAEVALEREDIETSLGDYQKALSILEHLVEPDSRHIAELNFRICLCLEIGSQPQEAILYCQKAISVCQARTQRLKNEANNVSESTSSSSASDSNKQAEIETLTGLAGDLEKKLEDLQQLVSNPKSILSEILGIAAAKAKGGEKSGSSSVLPVNPSPAESNGGFDSPTISTSQASGSSGVTHLGVVGRGVKRVVMNSGTTESNPTKKPALDSKEDDRNGDTS
ncbi:N-terminal acetyltransferase A, auxiliary subunit [Parasponia andersonii]|uniref:N-terminal acetyltransferase A, auxiliary subunit n=1 Tax=Parasponia andersonii TaxID=3476 RepID=A0A2P5BZB3_PARAD|nr:N-terminal acetyltransferase A, auxiliary subunit [Parasponia andersonii]